jgi:hypothetical protein
MHLFHSWSKWVTTHEGEVFFQKFEGTGFVRYPVGRHIIQQRECSICGRKQIRKIST